MNLQPHRSSEAGFTVLELLVASVIMVAVMTVVLTAIDMNANVSRIQTDVADVQQSVRVSQRDMHRLVRMVGRGGLPKIRSLAVLQDVPADTTIGAETVLEDTDILTLRGALRSPIFRVNSSDAASFVNNGNTATLIVDSYTQSGYEQLLDALHELVDEGGSLEAPEAVLIVGTQGDTVFAVTELANLTFEDLNVSILNSPTPVERATLTLNIDAAVGTHTIEYLALGGGAFPAALTSVLFVAVVEEHQYFIREDFSIPGDDTSAPSPKLARIRMLPGTDIVHPADNGALDIADNIFDLQIALGIDADADGEVESEDDDGNPLDTDADEWVWNDEADDAIGTQFPGLIDPTWESAPLHHVRLSILGQTQTPDRQYISEALESIENRDYSESPIVTGSDVVDRRYRRRFLQSTVDLRNIR